MSYERMVMEHTYEILTKDDFAWTMEFTPSMRIQMVELLLSYFKDKDIEDYEKCAKLQPMLEELERENEDNNKTNPE